MGECKLVIGKRCRGSCNNAIQAESHGDKGSVDGDRWCRRQQKIVGCKASRAHGCQNNVVVDSQLTCTRPCFVTVEPCDGRLATAGGLFATRRVHANLSFVDAQDHPATAATAIQPHTAHRLRSSRAYGLFSCAAEKVGTNSRIL